MATTIDSSSNPLAAYGYDAQTGQQLAQSLGMTTQQLAAAFATTPLTGGGTTQGTFMGGSSQGTNYQPPGRDLSATIQQLQLMKASGMGGGQQQSSGPPTSTPGGVSTDPMNAAVNLGASALGMDAVYNPTPGQIPKGSKGGVAQVASPTSSSSVPTVPQGPWSNVGSVFGPQNQQSQGLQYWEQGHGGGSAAEAAAIEKQNGWAPGSISQQFYNLGVQQGAITPANPGPATGGTPTPTAIPNPMGGRLATPYATAPAAPGASATPPTGMTSNPIMQAAQGQPPAQAQPPAAPGPQDVAAHHAALADAGMAMYQHMGGDPATATHQDIMDFHNQLNGMIGGMFGGAPPGAQNYTTGVGAPPSALPPGASGAPQAAGAAALKMSSGGIVPGRGNTDTVPALLTPGEYVIPKSQMVRMADGGYVPDPKDRDRPIPRSMTGQSTQSGGSTAGSGSSSGPQSSQSSINQAPAAPGSGASGTDWAKFAQQSRAYADQNSLNNLGSGAYSGGGGTTVGDTMGGAPSGQQVGVAQNLGQAPSQTGAAMGAISDLANGLTKAAQTYAASFKDWQIQPDAIGKFGSNVSKQQTQEPTFTETGS